jgi:signal transduction histidine kinase
LTEEQSQTLQSAYTAIQKLSNLNQSLLLLAKIENNQFEELQEVDLKKRIEEKLNDFNELWQSQNIIVNSELQNVVLNINSELADVLLNNLFSNATKHNFRGGNINIILVDHELKVINSSRNAALDEKKLFSRFYKSFAGSENNGLGLSIIKQICDASSLHIRYSYHDGQHAFTISW